jgi:hypothetical protein
MNDESDWEEQRNIREWIEELIGMMDSIFLLNGVNHIWESRMKELAAESLKPGDEPIEDVDALDYVWNLHGDGSWSSKQTEPFRAMALDYYVGRKVRHVWGTGTIVKMKEGYGIKVRLPCSHAGCRRTITVYAKPGCHRGAFCYVYDKDGNFLADLRDQSFDCGKCVSKKGAKK